MASPQEVVPYIRVRGGRKGGQSQCRPAAEMDGQERTHMLLKTSSYEMCGLFRKDPSLLKDHTGFSIVHEDGETSCSFLHFWLFPLLLWWDKKSCQEAR